MKPNNENINEEPRLKPLPQTTNLMNCTLSLNAIKIWPAQCCIINSDFPAHRIEGELVINYFDYGEQIYTDSFAEIMMHEILDKYRDASKFSTDFKEELGPLPTQGELLAFLPPADSQKEKSIIHENQRKAAVAKTLAQIINRIQRKENHDI